MSDSSAIPGGRFGLKNVGWRWWKYSESRRWWLALGDLLLDRKRQPYPDDFKFRIRAPWPQPSPLDERFPATVLHVPPQELKVFIRTVVKRYLHHLQTDSPKAAWHALRHPALEPISNEELVRIMTAGPCARLLAQGLDAADLSLFAAWVENDDNHVRWYKSDCSVMEGIEMLPGMHNGVACIALLQREEEREVFCLRAIAVNHVVWRPEDGEAWELAKHFMTAALGNSLIMARHPGLHFPYDCINALSKTLLPPNHLLAQLLKPHHDLQLPLNFAVLYVNKSVAHNSQSEIYTPFPFTRAGFVELAARGFAGLPGNRCYPKQLFRTGEHQPVGEYGRFLKAYYEVVLRFTQTVLSHIPQGEPAVEAWADHIARVLPGFPDGKAIFQGDMLARVAATYIHNVSIAHSCDHYLIGLESINCLPLRLRVHPPRRGESIQVDWRKATHRSDIFRRYMANVMYFRPSVVKSLMSCRYDFAELALQAAATRFLAELQVLDAKPPTRRFMPLAQIAASIQY